VIVAVLSADRTGVAQARARDEKSVMANERRGPKRGYWAVLRHTGVQRVSRDSATFRNARAVLDEHHARWRQPADER
jgi:hypothetical protein